MSTRHLRRLQGADGDLKAISSTALNESFGDEEIEEKEEIESTGSLQPGKPNFFMMLREEDCELEDQDQVMLGSAQHKSSKKKKNKKKKKRQEKQSVQEIDSRGEDEDEVDHSVRVVNQLLGAVGAAETEGEGGVCVPVAARSVLDVQHRYLNADMEMKRIFGAGVVDQGREGERRVRGRRVVPTTRRSRLVTPKNTWPYHGLSGLSMQLVERREGLVWFSFEHSSAYRAVQQRFWQAVDSMQPGNLSVLLQQHPYHVDTLLQLSEVFSLQEDVPQAADLIERSLLAFEAGMHPAFSLTAGNCRLDYRRQENRPFFLSVWRHLCFVSQRGCHRTAYEYCKLLLSLSPETDPLGALLAIDYFALRAKQYQSFLQLHQHWEAARNLSQLPSFSYSLPLAMYLLAEEQGRPVPREADLKLQQALRSFPGVLLPLLSLCSVTPDAALLSSTRFSCQRTDPPSLRQLQALYVGRSGLLWKPVLGWLQRNVQHVLQQPIDEQLNEKRQLRFKSRAPRNILRHILVSDIDEAKSSLPREVTEEAVLSHDPLPPTDAIVTYAPQQKERGALSGNPLGLFFRSLVPNFDPQQEAQEPQEQAEGGEPLQERITQVVAALRNMLNSVQLLPPPREDGREDDEQWREDDFDVD